MDAVGPSVPAPELTALMRKQVAGSEISLRD
jgi:hypothetical protein